MPRIGGCPWIAALGISLVLGTVRAEEVPLPPDALGAALADLGLVEGDLGYRPLGSWSRYPTLETTPYVLPFFPALHARPLATYEFTRTLGNAVEDLVTTEALLAAPSPEDRKETLFKAGVVLATDRRIGGLRGYSSNLDPRPEPTDPLLRALLLLLERSGAPLRREGAFGGQYDDPAADPRQGLRDRVAAVPAPLHVPLARLVLNLVDAREWIDRGLRRVPLDLRDRVFALLRPLSTEEPEGGRYPQELDEVARLVDEQSLGYGCLKALQATQDARREIGALPLPEGGPGWRGFHLRLPTPWGTIALGTDPEGGGDQRVEDPLLIVNWGDFNVLWGPVGATGPRRPLSVALLFDVDTTVGDSHGYDLRKDGGVGEVASGVLGCGIAYAAGKGSQAWRTGRFGLGAGLFGLGALVDEGGTDVYKCAAVGQGAGLFGVGLLLDAGGDDEYTLLEGDGQGYGGPNGIGVLGDRSGDDRYYAEPDAAKAGRADYHSEKKVAASSAQGAGFGRRGDGSDGHNWAGGLGALLDVEGDDAYTAGNFSQGIGFWYGTGLLWDGGGDDRYQSVYFTQGSGAHFAIGALIDEGGNDRHLLTENAGAALGFGWDVVNAFLIDRGNGNDVYEAKGISLGMAMVRSNAFFLDEGGDDRYVLGSGAQGFGQADDRPEYARPGRTSTFPFHLDQVAVFLDLGGTDLYLRRDGEAEPAPDADAADGKTWRRVPRVPGRAGGFNAALGRDAASGRLGFLDPWPARTSSAPAPTPPTTGTGR